MPAISQYMNNNQHDALYIFSLLSYHTSKVESTQKYNKHHLPRIYILPPDDGLLMHPKHVEVW
jgi:hypothetical protein